MSDKDKNTIQILDKSLATRFVQLPRAVLKAKKLSRNAKCLYALLLDYAWEKDQCFPGQNRLADDLDVSPKTIQRDLIELRLYRLIKWKRRGNTVTNIYYILPLSDIDWSEDNLGTRGGDTTDMTKQDATDVSLHDETNMSYKRYSVKDTKNKDIQSLTLPTNSNDNEEINISSFKREARMLATEFKDIKSIRYYQKIVSERDRGEIVEEDFQRAVQETRNDIRRDHVDGTNKIRAPGAIFVKRLQELIAERKNLEMRKSLREKKKSLFSIK